MSKTLTIKKVASIVLAVILVMLPFQLVVGAADSDSANYSVKANLPDNQRDTKKSYFDLRMTPNQAQTISVDVSNYASAEITVMVSANNAYTNQVGGIEYMQPNVKDTSLLYGFSDIATLSSDRLEIPANSTVTITVNLQMPNELYNGEIIGSLVFTKAIDESESKESINIVNRYTYAIGVVLSETDTVIRPNFEMISVYPELLNYRTALIFEIRNTMPIIADNGKISIEVFDGSGGVPIWKHENLLVRVAPNSKMDYAMYIEGEELIPGKYLAKVHLESEELSWDFEEEFEIIKEEAKSINEKTIIKQKNETIPIWAWLLSALLVLIAVLLTAVLFNMYRKNKK